MTAQHGKTQFRFLPLWVGMLGLVLGLPLLALSSGYGMGDAHSKMGASSPHHGAGAKGHEGGHPGGGVHGGHGMKGMMGSGGHGPPQRAFTFIDHILKFKDGMAITDDRSPNSNRSKPTLKKPRLK